MTVLLTHERFLPDWGGGGEQIVYETARGLLRKGVDVRVLTTGNPSIEEYQGVHTRRLPMSRYRFNLAASAIADAAKDVDLIQTFNYHACLPSLIAGFWRRKPVVCTMLGLFQEAWIEMRGAVAGRALMAFERMMVRHRFTRTIYLSEFSRAKAVAIGAPARTALVNNPGIDVASFQPGTKDGSILFAGKLEIRKGVWDVVEVARRLPHRRFCMAGWGPEEEELKRKAPPNVKFAGFAEGAPLHQLFAESAVFLFPSRSETFGMVVVEAMGAGCVIVSSVPLDFRGYVVRPGDIDGMATAVESVFRNPEATAKMSAENVAAARGYTWERYSDTLLQAYNEVLKQG
jgi:glycosyltransferase involved in cell wall biosynthesis